jgi:NTP pyrophosphatase (non-canonical NTP hydrolase)
MDDLLMLSDLTLEAVRAESVRAHLKHKDKGGSIFDPNMPILTKLAALVEEVGEVGRALTYDGNEGKDHLVKELIQVANVALTWVESLDTVTTTATSTAINNPAICPGCYRPYIGNPRQTVNGCTPSGPNHTNWCALGWPISTP